MKIDLTPNEVAMLSHLAINRIASEAMDADYRAALTAVHRKLDEAYAADYEQRRKARERTEMDAIIAATDRLREDRIAAETAAQTRAMEVEDAFLRDGGHMDSTGKINLSPPLAALRHHVTGAIERGEAEAITEVREEPMIERLAEALAVLLGECDTSDGFDPNLEGPEHDASEAARKLLEEYREA